MCFFGSFLLGEKKHINKIPPKNPDNPVKNLFKCFFLSVLLLSPHKDKVLGQDIHSWAIRDPDVGISRTKTLCKFGVPQMGV